MNWDKVRNAASTAGAWLQAHPRVVQAIGWVLLGFVLGVLVG